MDGAGELNQKLKFIEKELTALKTAHTHPLGSGGFYQQTKRITVNLPYTGAGGYDAWSKQFGILVKIADTDKTPIIQIGVLINTGPNWTIIGTGVSGNEFWRNYGVWSNTSAYTKAEIDVSVVSSVEILEIKEIAERL